MSAHQEIATHAYTVQKQTQQYVNEITRPQLSSTPILAPLSFRRPSTLKQRRSRRRRRHRDVRRRRFGRGAPARRQTPRRSTDVKRRKYARTMWRTVEPRYVPPVLRPTPRISNDTRRKSCESRYMTERSHLRWVARPQSSLVSPMKMGSIALTKLSSTFD